MIVAIQGELGSFSEHATRAVLGDDARILSCSTFDELFSAVSTGRADRGMVPVRNSIAGPVYDNAARARTAEFQVVGEVALPVRQCLIARQMVGVDSLRRVASHPVALRQCTRFFAAHPACVAVAIADTAGGVRDLMAGLLDADAVIASEAAARRFGAVVLTEGIEDDPQNITEFLLIAPAHEALGPRTGASG